ADGAHRVRVWRASCPTTTATGCRSRPASGWPRPTWSRSWSGRLPRPWPLQSQNWQTAHRERISMNRLCRTWGFLACLFDEFAQFELDQVAAQQRADVLAVVELQALLQDDFGAALRQFADQVLDLRQL